MTDREEVAFLSNKMDSRNTKETILLRRVVAVSMPVLTPVLVQVQALVLGWTHPLVPLLRLLVIRAEFEALLALSAAPCFVVQLPVGRLSKIHLISCHLLI